MHGIFTTKRCRISANTQRIIDRYCAKMETMLGKYYSLFPLEIIIRKYKNKYEGMLKLVLPYQPLIAHIQNDSIDEALTQGFHRIIKELETYKGKHVPSDSEYFCHDSIRRWELGRTEDVYGPIKADFIYLFGQ